MFFLLRGGQSILRPIAAQFLKTASSPSVAPRVLSAVSMAYGLARAPFMSTSGAVADAAGPFVAVAGLGATFLVCGVALHLLAPPVLATPADEAGPSPAD